MLFRVRLRVAFANFTIERQMQPITDEDLRYAGRVLVHLLQPPVQTVKGPLIRYVIHQQYTLRPTRVGPYDCAEATLAGRVPQLQFDPLTIQQNCGGFIRFSAAAAKRGLGGAILQVGDDLLLAHITITNQEELQQVVVGLLWWPTAILSHNNGMVSSVTIIRA